MKKKFFLPLFVFATVVLVGCNGGSTPAPPANGQPQNGNAAVADPGSNPAVNPAVNPGEANFKAMPGQSTPIHFSHLEMNFNPVVSGDTVKAIYPFKNMSQETVKITQAVTSCDCMQTKFPRGNVQPGQYGEIEVHFLTAGQKGRHEKIIAVVLENYEESITLRLNGQIN